MLLTGLKSHKGESPVARELGFKVPVDCCGVWTAEEVQGACLGPLIVLHGGVHAAHWNEVTQGCVTSGKRAGLQGTRGLLWVWGLQLQKRSVKTRWMLKSEAAAYYLGWGSFPVLVLLQVGEYLALLVRAGYVLN